MIELPGGGEGVADVDVVVVVGQEKVGGPRSISEIIWAGRIVPWSAIRSLITASVIVPGPWCPMIGIPLTAAMSTAAP